MAGSKERQNEHGTFVLTRAPERLEFNCDRCRKPKVAKITVAWAPTEGGPTKIICNACYGYLVSGSPQA